ncbi:MAG: hypothetical protein SGPRY_014949 [Prymnesium sp.]
MPFAAFLARPTSQAEATRGSPLSELPAHLISSPSYFGSWREPRAPVPRSLLSRTLGSHMVLQRAPQRAVVWGFAQAGTKVATTLDGQHQLTTLAGADGIWRQLLPAMPASVKSHRLDFVSSAGERASMEDVLFGDVYLCGGQSNMQFSAAGMENATEEIARANKYPLIRLFTVGQKTKSREPLSDLQTVEEGWSVASAKAVGNGTFTYFSAVCWVFGREVFDALDGEVPIGLISNNWGGTPVESWTTPEVLKACQSKTVDSVLYNAMIHPYTLGPMALLGFTWYQGEANVDERRGVEGAAMYSCTFPGMIQQWRKAFARPDAYFGFVQLSTWCGNGELIAESTHPLASPPFPTSDIDACLAVRTRGQMAALALPRVGYATNADHGAGCNIHPPPKQYCAKRLANSALALAYGRDILWKSPSFGNQLASAFPPSVHVRLRDVSPRGLRDDYYPFNYLGGAFNCTLRVGKCAWAELLFKNGVWVNATLSVSADGMGLTVTAPPIAAGWGEGAPVASRYGWGAVPMMSVYDRQTGLPVLPWYENVSRPQMVEEAS